VLDIYRQTTSILLKVIVVFLVIIYLYHSITVQAPISLRAWSIEHIEEKTWTISYSFENVTNFAIVLQKIHINLPLDSDSEINEVFFTDAEKCVTNLNAQDTTIDMANTRLLPKSISTLTLTVHGLDFQDDSESKYYHQLILLGKYFGKRVQVDLDVGYIE
jgi:hypothetical protein